ncbi:MAG: hypothetical protein NVS3B21_27150 [Acidimicrobiales bacterium]
MTVTAAARGRRTGSVRLRPIASVSALVAALIAVGVLGATGGGGAALDPDSTGPQGTKALALLLGRYGARAERVEGVPGESTRTALLLSDDLTDGRRAALTEWVRRGGTLVVADPRSALQVGIPVRPGRGVSNSEPRPVGPCSIPGLTAISALSVGPSLLLRVPPGAQRLTCFTDRGAPGGGAAFLVAAGLGRGLVVGLGGAGLWTNARLDHQDNAALAVALLAPGAGDQVGLLLPAPGGNGSKTGLELTSPAVRQALLQLLVAFGVLAWWRGRRLGKPVTETTPVRLAGSLIVTATGALMARTRSCDAAAAQLRAGARRRLRAQLGYDETADLDRLVDALVAHFGQALSGRDRSGLVALLADGPVGNDASLLRLARGIAQLCQEVNHDSIP